MKHKTTSLAFALVATLLLGPAAAGEPGQRALTADSRTLFDDQAAAIRQQMQPGGYYEFVSAENRTLVERGLDAAGAVLARQDDPRQFTDKDKVELLQAQESVNAVLTKNDGRRLICERRAPTGSHLGKDKCVTFAERERIRRESQKVIRDRQSQPSGASGLPSNEGRPQRRGDFNGN